MIPGAVAIPSILLADHPGRASVQDDNEEEEEEDSIVYSPESATHYLLGQRTQRLNVGVVVGGIGLHAAAVLESARGVLDGLPTRPHTEQLAMLMQHLDEV